ncbi:DEAD/DEAH box helicase [Serinicoccus kebangsaanensis]|uniref:DEAD/DEAH box helicase n=1 Tax=Serinicoccus kebangsaanensis TaxID=2602069 RepID=UPI00192DB60B|nr:DEAD/DEAH box helicase [Serinicoccus kebangsaanensis]
MAKPARAGASGKKKPRHTAAQKKAARQAREKQARAQLKGGRGDRRSGAGSSDRPPRGSKDRWRDRDERDPRGRGDRAESRSRGRDGDERPRRRDDRYDERPRRRDDRYDERPRRRDDRDERGGRREDRRGYQEHTWRAHREEREGRPGRGRHEGRPWEERRRDRGWDERDDRRRRPTVERAAFDDAEADRDEADQAYQQRLAGAAAEDSAAVVTADNGFAGLGLREELVGALARTGITAPFPIQAATIPDAMAGRDLLGRGQTGSGKTMAFGLPLLDRLATRPRAVPHRPRAVILTPTRELAMQISDALAPLIRAVDRRFVLVAGGMPYTPQLRALEKGVDVLVATPGRLIDLIDRSAADLSEVEVMVLDEADHMAEMGFVEAIRQILDLTPAQGQRLLFSATLDHGVDDVARTYLKDPVTHSTDDARASVTTMAHHIFLVHPHHKKPITAAIANRSGRTVVFCRTKLGADRVALQLRESGVFAAALHGGLNQAQRTRVLDAFKSGTLPVLVATDVAARGIHVDDVSLVLQVDPPADHKDYLHRSGRTARAGEDGVVVTLALPHQKRQVARMLDAAGVETEPRPVAPEDHAVIETAGGAVPEGEPVPQSRLDDVMRPRRAPRRGGPGRGRGHGGPRPDQRRRPGRGGYDRGRGRRGADGDGGRRQDWRPRD